MFHDLEVCTTKEIAAKCFAATPEYVGQQVKAGHFPAPSWRTPGLRGKLVWLVPTVERWLTEYEKRVPEGREKLELQDRQAAHNDAAVTATKIAEQFDSELRAKLFDTNRSVRSAPSRESTSERDSSEMVPA